MNLCPFCNRGIKDLNLYECDRCADEIELMTQEEREFYQV